MYIPLSKEAVILSKYSIPAVSVDLLGRKPCWYVLMWPWINFRMKQKWTSNIRKGQRDIGTNEKYHHYVTVDIAGRCFSSLSQIHVHAVHLTHTCDPAWWYIYRPYPIEKYIGKHVTNKYIKYKGSSVYVLMMCKHVAGWYMARDMLT